MPPTSDCAEKAALQPGLYEGNARTGRKPGFGVVFIICRLVRDEKILIILIKNLRRRSDASKKMGSSHWVAHHFNVTFENEHTTSTSLVGSPSFPAAMVTTPVMALLAISVRIMNEPALA